jgi:hypothetical protein
MKRTNVALTAFLIACISGVALAQDSRTKAGGGPPLKAQPQKAAQVPNTYGTASVSYYRMGGSEFDPIATSDAYTDSFYSDNTTYRRYGADTFASFIGTPHLPSGAKVLAVYGSLYGAINVCGSSGSLCTVIAPYTGSMGCGFDTVDVSAAGYVVDNSPGGNLMVIRLVTGGSDGSDSIAGAVVAYQLQVSPAPGSATFPDVPVSDFGFQYVEALVASGITGGCGGGLYCPDNPVTRRQMAIFIAKSLGLHFP